MEATRLICIGDSITWGFPYGPDYSWVRISAEAVGQAMINRGINGDTAADLLARFNRDVVAHDPSHVFIMAGTNDAAIGLPLASYQDKILKMHASALGNGICPAVGLPIPSDEKFLEHTLEKYRLWLKDFASQNRIAAVDFAPAMLLQDGCINRECYLDDVHPSKIGYRKMAGVFTNFCKKL